MFDPDSLTIVAIPTKDADDSIIDNIALSLYFCDICLILSVIMRILYNIGFILQALNVGCIIIMLIYNEGEFLMNKKFSKILGVAIVLCMVIGLSACGTDTKTPEGATEAYLKDLQKGDVIKWQEQISGRKLSDDEKKQLKKNFEKSPQEQFNRMKDFEFKVIKAKEVKKGKEAEATVEITTYDFVKVTQNMNTYFTKNLGKLKAMKEDKLNETIDKEMKKEFDKTDKNIKNKAKLKLTYNKKKEAWKVIDVNSNFEFQDALMGGYLTKQAQRSNNSQQQSK